jgi:hypothetical protein
MWWQGPVNLCAKGGKNFTRQGGCNGVQFLFGEGGKIEDPLTLEGGYHGE